MTDAPLGSSSPPSTPKTTIGGYEIIAKIGQGAMGTVFKARQVSMDRIVALKILKPDFAKDHSFVARFLREARAAAQLNHPNIVQAFDAGNADGYSYFAMEYVDGHSLQGILNTAGALSESRALEITRDIAFALDCAHMAGVIHRDVKPDNILIATDGSAKLADLGIARRASSSDAGLTQAGQTLGTPDYISPEQIRGELNIDGRSDIYSLAATLYHMLTGHAPFRGGTNAEVMSMHLTRPAPNVREAAPHVSARTSALIRRGMAKSQDDRHTTAREFATDAEMLLKGASTAITFQPETTPTRAKITVKARAPLAAKPAHRRTPGFSPAKIGGIAAIAVLALLGLYLLLGGMGTDKKTREERRKFAAIGQWVAEHPGQYQQGIARYERLRRTVTDSECKENLEQALGALTAAQSKAANTAFARTHKRASQLSGSGGYIEAIKAYRAIPNEFQGILGARISRAIAATTAEAAAKTKSVLKNAQALLDKGDPTAGMALLEKISHMQHPTLADEVQALRKTMEPASFQQLLAARKKINQVLESLNAPAAKGQLATAARTAHTAALDPAFSCIKSSADALVKLGEALLKANKNPGLAPQTPDEHIAAALLALAAEDAARMEASIRGAANHDFHDHYETKLQQMKERLQQREADKQEQQQARLMEFRSTLASVLKKREYVQVVAELDSIIADPQLSLIRKEATADCRALSKLVTLLQHIRNNARIEANKRRKTQVRYRGMPTTIKAYDRKTDKVTFGSGQSQAIASMRAADLKELLDLKRGPAAEYHECLALLALADGEITKVRPLLANVADRTNIEHLMKVLGEFAETASADAGDNGDDNSDGDGDDTPQATLTDQQRTTLQEMLAKNRDIFNTHCSTVNEDRDARKAAYQERAAPVWADISSKVRRLQKDVQALTSSVQNYKPSSRYSSYKPSLSYLRRRLASFQRRFNSAAQEKAQVADKIRSELGIISKRASAVKARLRTTMLRHKRLMLMGREVTEDQMTNAYDKALRGAR